MLKAMSLMNNIKNLKMDNTFQNFVKTLNENGYVDIKEKDRTIHFNFNKIRLRLT